nr:hypothetical protein [Tanacetum cinerariifolium]
MVCMNSFLNRTMATTLDQQAYKEYYAYAIGEAAPKPKASARKKTSDEGTGSRPGVLDVPSDDSEEELSWNSSDDEDVDEQTKGREEKVTNSDEGDDEATESDREIEDEEIRE